MPRMLRAWRRIAAVSVAVVLICAALALGASAQSSDDTGIILITVKSADAAAPLSNARVFLLGPSVASALTNKSGIVKYTDAATGLYRVRVSRPGYRTSTSAQFELLGNKEVDVDVALGPTNASAASTTAAASDDGGPQIIARVVAKVTVSTHDVNQDSAVRRISDSLTDALNTLAGVDVTQSSNDPDSPQTISLHGHDESQTAVTLDGIPLGAPGTAVNLRGLNTDLFTGAHASFGAEAGALGGGVNFTTLQPTQTWQTRGSGALGSFDKYNWSIGETGSIGNLGVAALVTRRGGNNPLTFQDYLDQSGITYAHGGEQTNSGEFIKLRYGLDADTTLMFTALENNQYTSTLCTQFTGPVPCGIGPYNYSTGKFQFVYGTVQSLVGQVALQVTGYISDSNNNSNQLNRTIDECVGAAVPCPVPQPYAAETSSLTRGVAFQASISKDNHTITLNGAGFSTATHFNPLFSTGSTSLVATPSVNAVSGLTLSLNDSVKIDQRLSLGPILSLASTTGVGASVLGGVSADWRPNDTDDFGLSAQVGSSQPAPAIVRNYSDPQNARVICDGRTATISGPGDLPTAQSAVDYQATWTHTWAHGQLSVDAYRQNQTGQLVQATLTAAAAGLPSDIFAAVQQYYSFVCPMSLPASVYVSEPVNNTTRVYQGFDIVGRLALGRDVTVIPSWSTNSSFYTAADAAYLEPGSTLILNTQIYGRPLHKGNLTIDAYNPPSGLEFLANLQYVGTGNVQHLPSYALLSLGLSHPFGFGMLTLFETNVFNTYNALFSTLNNAVYQPLNGGGLLPVVANPLTPRTIQVSYTFNTGARSGAGFAHVRGSGAARQVAAAPSPSASPNPRGALGFGQLKFIAPPEGVDPLSLATSRPECTADLQAAAATVLAQLGAAAKAYAAGATTLPDVTGLLVTPHGAPTGAWYFALGPNIPRDLFPRPPGGAQGGRNGAIGPGGPGGPPGFAPRIAVGPNSQPPRPQFTPSPQLIAAIKPFRAFVSCSYGTVLTPDEAQARGFDIQPPGLGRPRPAPSSSPAPGASPGPTTRVRGGGFIDYAPSPGVFVVRPPDLGTGGGSVKQ